MHLRKCTNTSQPWHIRAPSMDALNNIFYVLIGTNTCCIQTDRQTDRQTDWYTHTQHTYRHEYICIQTGRHENTHTTCVYWKSISDTRKPWTRTTEPRNRPLPLSHWVVGRELRARRVARHLSARRAVSYLLMRSNRRTILKKKNRIEVWREVGCII